MLGACSELLTLGKRILHPFPDVLTVWPSHFSETREIRLFRPGLPERMVTQFLRVDIALLKVLECVLTQA